MFSMEAKEFLYISTVYVEKSIGTADSEMLRKQWLQSNCFRFS